jgi:multisubunit Na+/H+ antiporter MnhB subunit
MTCRLVLIGGSPSLPYIVLLLLAPVVVVLLWLAFRLARNPQQRLTDLLSGGVGAVGATFALIYLFEPAPDSWYEDNLALFVVAAMVAGAAIGVSLCAIIRVVVAGRPKSGAN